MQGFRSDATLSNLLQYFPTKGKDDTLQYSDFGKQMNVPFVIYCDFETLNERTDTCHTDPNKSSTTPTTKCEPCGYGYKVVCVDSRYAKPTVIFRQHASKHFLKALLSERAYIKDVLSRIEPLNMTEMDELTFKSTTT